MIKIIKKGKESKKVKTVFLDSCIYCGCEFEFELEDCIQEKIQTKEKPEEIFFWINCPCCNYLMGKPRHQFEYTQRICQ